MLTLWMFCMCAKSVHAPLIHNWVNVLTKVTSPSLIKQTLARVVLDQSIIGPLVPAMFFTFQTLTEGGAWKDAYAKLNAAWLRTWKVGLLVFVPVAAINMTFIPHPSRVLFATGASFLWNIYLSHCNQQQRLQLAQVHSRRQEP